MNNNNRGLASGLNKTVTQSILPSVKSSVLTGISGDSITLKSVEMYTNLITNKKTITKPTSLDKTITKPNNSLRYVPVGNMHMSLKTLKNHFNYIIKTLPKFNNGLIEGNAYTYRIRHYLNMLTRFNLKLSNSSYSLYFFNKSNKSNKILLKMEKAAQMLRIAFLTKGCLISKPRFNIVSTSDTLEDKKSNKALKTKIIIDLFYLIKSTTHNNLTQLGPEGSQQISITNVYNKKFLYLIDYLTKLFNTEIELNLVRLYQPYQDSEILVNYLNNESYNNKFIKLTSRLFKNMKIYKINKNKIASLLGNNNTKTIGTLTSSYPSGISGINIKLAGRPINEKIIPRLTVKRAQRGNFNRLNTKVTQISTFTDKSRKGAFNFTVRLSHIFR